MGFSRICPFIIKWMRKQLSYSIRPTGSTSTLPFAQQWQRPHLTKWPLLSVIAEKVPTKSIKRNSIGLPIEIRELIRQKRHKMRLWQRTRMPQYKTNANRLQKRISKDITIRKRDSWKMYCDDMELSEGQGATWGNIRSVLKPKSAPYNLHSPSLQRRRWDKDQISDYDRETGDIRVPVGRGLYQRNSEQRFRRGKDRRRRRIRPAHCQKKTQVRRTDWHTREG